MTLIDHNRLNSLLLLSVKNKPQLLQMLQNLIDCAPQNTKLLTQFTDDKLDEPARHLLHKIRGSFATVGADELAKSALLLEERLSASNRIESAMLQRFIMLYQQSCAELQTVVRAHTGVSGQPAAKFEPELLRTLLLSHDMNACNVVLQHKADLQQLMNDADAALFCHQVASLNFAAAATLLHAYLPAVNTDK
tara:strand:- start:5905 stop:6483 length:579 start_codon:yes stop_codon:yes gene_type:complete